LSLSLVLSILFCGGYWSSFWSYHIMIAFLLAITISIGIRNKDSVGKISSRSGDHHLSTKKNRFHLDPDKAGCYDAYVKLDAQLVPAEAERNVKIGLQNNNIKVLALTEALVTAFQTECPTTSAAEKCDELLTALVPPAVAEGVQATFRKECFVSPPATNDEAGNNDDNAQFTLVISNFLLLMSLLSFGFYFTV
jgi:hypothetical protein